MDTIYSPDYRTPKVKIDADTFSFENMQKLCAAELAELVEYAADNKLRTQYSFAAAIYNQRFGFMCFKPTL